MPEYPIKYLAPLTKEEAISYAEQFVSIMGDKWSLLLIAQLAFGKSPSRFNELMRVLSPISSRTLSIKLTNLTERGIIKKEIENASPPFTLYSLTEMGVDLVFAFKAMADWSLKWLKPNLAANQKILSPNISS
jgi:DNA-binding HxlR family transcriptional regulator